MEQRFAAGNGDGAGAQFGQLIQTLVHHIEGDRLGVVVEFVAIGAGQIAAAHGDDVRQNRVVRGGDSPADHPEFPNAAADRLPTPPEMQERVRHTAKSFYYNTVTAFCRGFVSDWRGIGVERSRSVGNWESEAGT